MVATQARATIEGQPPEVTKLAVDKVVSDTHEQIIQALAAEDQGKALEYYKNYKPALLGEADVRVAKLMDTVKGQQGARNTADEAQKKFPGSVAEQIKHIDELGIGGKITAEQREKAKAYVQNDFNLAKIAQEAESRATADAIVKQIDAAKEAGKTWAQIEAENVNQLLKLPEDDATRLKKYYEYKVEGRNSTTRAEQLTFYQNFTRDLATPSVDITRKYSIDQVDRMAPDAFRSDMLKAFSEAASGQKTTSINLVSNKAEVDALMKKLGVKNENDQLEMRGAIQQRIEMEVARRGKDMSPAEVRKLVSDYATEVVTGPRSMSNWFVDTKRVYQITPDTDISQAQVPAADREKILASFLKLDANATPTEAEIRQVYLKQLKRVQDAQR